MRTININGEIYLNLEDLKQVIEDHKINVTQGIISPYLIETYILAHDHINDLLSVYDSPEIVKDK